MANGEVQATSVVIAGAGPAGLCLAIELGMRGVPCVVLDEGTGTSKIHKANATQARTMEHYRRMGFADEIRGLGLPSDYPTDVAYVIRFGTRELARVRLPAARDVKELARQSTGSWSTPELPHRCNQVYVENALRKHAASFPSNTMLFGWQVKEFQDRGSHVQVVAMSASQQRDLRIRSDYLVGCDGARSVVRTALGIEMEGEAEVVRNFVGGPMCAICFRCPDLYERMSVDRAWMYWAFNAERRGVLIAVDGVDTFLFQTQIIEGEHYDDPLPHSLAQHWFEQAFGGPCPIKVEYSAYWRAGYAQVAQSYGKGRVAIAGDAAHLFTPSGGLGYNTAVDDVVNLGWKIAAAVKGYGGEGLIDSYDAERRPIGKRNTGIARSFADGIGNYIPDRRLEEVGPDGERARQEASHYIEDHGRREFNIPGVTFGVRYDGSPIIIPDGTPPPDSPNLYVPSGVPGGRAPHLWTDGGGSLYDRLGRDFTLLVLSGEAVVGGWIDFARQRSIPLEIFDISAERCAPEARELYGASLALIRPDLHIAWRGPDSVDPGQVFARVLGRIAEKPSLSVL